MVKKNNIVITKKTAYNNWFPSINGLKVLKYNLKNIYIFNKKKIAMKS